MNHPVIKRLYLCPRDVMPVIYDYLCYNLWRGRIDKVNSEYYKRWKPYGNGLIYQEDDGQAYQRMNYRHLDFLAFAYYCIHNIIKGRYQNYHLPKNY